MVKYRILTKEELESLESDFVKFLIVQGIDVDSWLDIKNNKSDKAQELLEQFSDIIIESVIGKAAFVEFADSKGIKIFKCDADEISLIGIESEESIQVDFYDKLKLWDLLKTRPSLFSIYKASKQYIPDRSTEIWKMINKGGIICDDTWYNILNNLKS